MRNDDVLFRISDFIYKIVKRRVLLVILTISGLFVGIIFSGVSYMRGEMSKEYLITTSFSINTKAESGVYTSGHEFPDRDDINMATDLTESVAYVLKSDTMLNAVIERLSLLGVTATDISNNLKIVRFSETQIMEMSLYWRSSEEGVKILSSINDIAAEMLMKTLDIGSISVINSPSSKYILGGNLNIMLWLYVALVGLFLGLVIILLELIMRPTLLNVKDMERLFGKDVFCDIPVDKAYFGNPELILEENNELNMSIRENFAYAAHLIHRQLLDKNTPHIIYITSALDNEGKTSVAANLAVQLSNLEKRVLLIDLDMKNPNLGSIFLKKVDYAHSLNALYVGDIIKSEVITSLTGYLDLVPTILERNTIPLDSNLFEIIQELAKGYDYVLLDTAAVGVSADPMSVSRIASAALFVAKYDTASLKEIETSVKRVEKSGVDFLGYIVNGVKTSQKGVKNPIKEIEKIKKADAKKSNLRKPMIKFEDSQSDYKRQNDQEKVEDSLVVELTKSENTEAIQNDREIVSSNDFVEMLFAAENKREEIKNNDKDIYL